MRKYLLTFCLISAGFSAYTQTSLGFQNVYNYPSQWQNFSGSNGNVFGSSFYLLGNLQDPSTFSEDYLVIKVDTSSNLKWVKTYSYGGGLNPGGNLSIGCINPDTYNSSTTPESMIISGTDGSFPDNANITKIDSSGNVIFSLDFVANTGYFVPFSYGDVAKSTPGKNYYFLGNINAHGNSFSTPNSGGMIVNGGAANYNPSQDILIAKINTSATNDTVFTKTIGLAYNYSVSGTSYDSTRSDIPEDFVYDKSSNGLYITGFTMSNSSNAVPPALSFYRTQIFVMKTDTLGTPQWVKTMYLGTGNENTSPSGGYEYGFGIVKIPSSTDYLVSASYGDNTGLMLIRITNAGSVTWAKVYTFGGGGGCGYKICTCTDGNVLASATVWDAASGGTYCDMLMMEINPSTGAVVSSLQTGGTYQDGTDYTNWYGPSVMQVGIGSYGMIGNTTSFGVSTYGGALLVKTQRKTFMLGGGSCSAATVSPTITDVTPGGSSSAPLQVRTPVARVGSSGPGYSIPIKVTNIGTSGSMTTTNRTTSFTNTQNCYYALPIKLIDFSGEYKAEGEYSALKWSTATETNNHYFFIGRSSDGENWQIIDTVPGAGNSNNIRRYSLKDPNPPIGINYYRLTQQDYDGNETSSNIVAINVPIPNSAKIYPNPVTNVVTIEKAGLAEVRLFNLLGQLIWTANAIDSRATIDMSSNSPGIYIIQTIDNFGRMVDSKLIKEGQPTAR